MAAAPRTGRTTSLMGTKDLSAARLMTIDIAERGRWALPEKLRVGAVW